jgi:hypothetical protein
VAAKPQRDGQRCDDGRQEVDDQHRVRQRIHRAEAGGPRDRRIESAREDVPGFVAEVVVRVVRIRRDREVVLAVVAELALPPERRAEHGARVGRGQELTTDVHEPECAVLLDAERRGHGVERDHASDGTGD